VKIKMLPGFARELYGEAERRKAMREHVRRQEALAVRDATGLKRMYLLGVLDNIVRTPYGAKEVRRRRAANRVAKLARRRNR
jgi:hypothetical protein